MSIINLDKENVTSVKQSYVLWLPILNLKFKSWLFKCTHPVKLLITMTTDLTKGKALLL